jgi:macrolide-specific efflux system membrane fusion protein
LSLSKADLAIAQAELRYQQAQNDRDDVLKPDLAKLRSDLEEARRALSQARVSLVELQTEKTTEAKLWTLREAEAKASAEYSRLATETYRDSFYEDRRYVAYNKLLTAQDARVTAEVQQKTNLLKAETQVRKAEATLAAAEKALATALAGGDKLALGKAELAVKEAEVSLATARTARADLLAGTDAATLTAAQADVDKKRLALGEAEAALAGTKLTAPFDGTVLRVPVRVGSTINQSTQILTLANLKSLQVVASVDETTIRRVQVGQNTTVTFDAVPGQTVRGRVTEVPLQGALQGNVMVYEVPISLTGADALPLLVGMTANVQIQTAQAANAVLVPAVAVKQNGSAYQVMLANGDDPNAGGQAVDVEIGLSDGTNTQIVRGLKAGDKVLVQYTARTTTTTSQQQQNQQFGQQFGQQPGQIPQGGQIPGGIPQPGQGGR